MGGQRLLLGNKCSPRGVSGRNNTKYGFLALSLLLKTAPLEPPARYRYGVADKQAYYLQIAAVAPALLNHISYCRTCTLLTRVNRASGGKSDFLSHGAECCLTTIFCFQPRVLAVRVSSLTFAQLMGCCSE